MKTYDRRDEVISKIVKRYGFKREDDQSKLEKLLTDLYNEAHFDGYIKGMRGIRGMRDKRYDKRLWKSY